MFSFTLSIHKHLSINNSTEQLSLLISKYSVFVNKRSKLSFN